MWFDEGAVETVIEVTPTWVAITLLFIGYLGSIYVVAPGVTLAYVRGDSWKTATWPGILIGAYGLFVALKAALFIERPQGPAPPFSAEVLPVVLRPVYDLAVQFETGTFPSGHALAATVFWGLVVIDTDVGRLWQRFCVATVIVTLVGLSRIVLGLHYVVDIIGGVALGLALLGVMVVVRRWASNPANATLVVALLPVAAGFPAGTPLEAGALLTLLASVYLLNEHTDLIASERLSNQQATENTRQHTSRCDADIE